MWCNSKYTDLNTLPSLYCERSSVKMLHKAITAAREGDLEALGLLRASGGLAPDIADDQGATPVHHAARGGRVDCLRFLVGEANLKGNARARNGATAAHDAAATGHVQELQWLLGHGECRLEVRDRNRPSLRKREVRRIENLYFQRAYFKMPSLYGAANKNRQIKKCGQVRRCLLPSPINQPYKQTNKQTNMQTNKYL